MLKHVLMPCTIRHSPKFPAITCMPGMVYDMPGMYPVASNCSSAQRMDDDVQIPAAAQQVQVLRKLKAFMWHVYQLTGGRVQELSPFPTCWKMLVGQLCNMYNYPSLPLCPICDTRIFCSVIWSVPSFDSTYYEVRADPYAWTHMHILRRAAAGTLDSVFSCQILTSLHGSGDGN